MKKLIFLIAVFISNFSIMGAMRSVDSMDLIAKKLKPIPVKDLSTVLTFHHRTKTIREWIFDENNLGNIPVVQMIQETPNHSPRVIKIGDLRGLTARQLIIMLEGPSLYFDDKITPFCNSGGLSMPCIACGNFKKSLYNEYNSMYVEGL